MGAFWNLLRALLLPHASPPRRDREWVDDFILRRRRLRAACASLLARGAHLEAQRHLTGAAALYDPELYGLLAECHRLVHDREKYLKYCFMSGAWPETQRDEIIAWARKHFRGGGFPQFRSRLPEPFWSLYARRFYSEQLKQAFKDLRCPAYLLKPGKAPR